MKSRTTLKQRQKLSRRRITIIVASSITAIIIGFCIYFLLSSKKDASASGKENGVELDSFSVESKRDSVEVKWSTTKETNNDHFTIERCLDGKSFESAGQVKGRKKSKKIVKYYWVEPSPMAGTWQYRLKQVNEDGTEKIVASMSVEIKSSSPSLISMNTKLRQLY